MGRQHGDVESLADDLAARIRISIPVKVTKDSDGHTVALQPLIKAVTKAPDGKVSLASLPVLSDVPIQYGGEGASPSPTRTRKAMRASTCSATAASMRGHQQGNEQPQIDARMLSMSDGFYSPTCGPRRASWRTCPPPRRRSAPTTASTSRT